MLNIDELTNDLKNCFTGVLSTALKRMEEKRLPTKTEVGDKMVNDIVDTFINQVSEPLAKVIAQSIDSYVKNITITGQIVTNGSPTTQVAIIIPAANPTAAGSTPNTLKIQ